MSLPWLSDPRRPLTSPREIPKLEAWFDALDTSTMLTGAGATITDGGSVALWSDKSGNSGVSALYVNGASGNCAFIPSAAAVNVFGNGSVEFVACVRLASFRLFQNFIAKYESTGDQRSYEFGIDANGAIRLGRTTDGTAGTSVAVVSTSVLPDTAFAAVWVKAAWDFTNGTVDFSTAPWSAAEPTSWSPLGTQVAITAGAPYNGTARVDIGARASGTATNVNGHIYQAKIRNGIDGTTVLDIDFSLAGKKLANGDTFVCATGQTVTLNSSGATGARIAGERDLFQGTLANRPVYLQYAGTKYGYLNGTAGNYFSTQDSDSYNLTNIEVITKVTLADWTPSAITALVGKFNSTTNQRSFLLLINPDGTLQFNVSTNGTSSNNIKVTDAALGLSDGSSKWLKASWVGATGAIILSISDDGVTWSTPAATQTLTQAGTVFNSTAAVEVGSSAAGTTFNLNGRVERAVIKDGIDGNTVADFNPALYTSGTTFTASTGEVWTINGGAHIVTRTGLYFDGSNDYLKTAAFSLSQPETVYLAGSQVSWTDNDKLYDGNDATSARMALVQSAGGASPQLSLFSGTTLGTNSGLALQTCGAISAVFNGATSSLRVNRGTSLSGNAGTNAASGFTLASSGTGGTPANMTTSEVAIYSAAHNAATQDRMAVFASRKWGFAV